MEKVLDIVKGIFAGFIDLLIHPISKVAETVQSENIKKGAIKAVILSAVLSVVNVLSRIRIIHIAFNTNSLRENAMEELNPMLAILKMFGLYLLIIIAIALVLFVISKAVRDQKSLPYTLSMTVNSLAVYAVGATLALALSFWTPLSALVLGITTLHSVITLVVAFISSLTSVDTDKLVLVAAVVLMIFGIIVSIIRMISTSTSLSNYTDSKYSSSTMYSSEDLINAYDIY